MLLTSLVILVAKYWKHDFLTRFNFQTCNCHDCMTACLVNRFHYHCHGTYIRPDWWINLLSRSGLLSSSLSRILRPRLKHKIMIFFKSYSSCMFSDHSNLPMRINCVDFSYKPLHENMSISTCTPHTLSNLFWNLKFKKILSPISN